MNYITLSQAFSGPAVGQPGEAVPLSGPSLLVQTTPGCTATVYGSNLPKIEATWQVIGTASGYAGTALTSKFAFIRVSLSAAGSVAISATQNSTSTSTPGSGPVTSDDITDASAIGKQLLQAADAAAARAALDVPTTAAVAAKYTKPAGGIPATDLDADPAGRTLLTAASAAERKQVLGLDQVNNTSDANKPISTAQQIALDSKMAATLPALQAVFDAGTAPEKAAFQSSVSGAGTTTYSLRTPYSVYGTTARIDLGSITIPEEKLPPGAYIKGWAMFSGTRNAATKTHIIGINDAGGGAYGATDIFNAALATSNYAGNRIEFYARVINDDQVKAGVYGSSSGVGPVSSTAAVNPVAVQVNLRGGGLDIAFGGSVAAPTTGTVSISQATPGVVSWTAHGLVAGQKVKFSAPPAPLIADVIYHVVSGPTLLTDSFTVSEQRGGTSIETTAAAASITATAYTELTLVDAHIEVTA